MDKPYCFLDLDGTVADFVGATCRMLGIPHTADYGNPPKGRISYDMDVQTGRTGIWEQIAEAGPGFWLNIPPLPWADALIATLRDRVNLRVLTSPSSHPGITHHAATGKMLWCRRYLDIPSHHVIPLGEKFLVAGPGRLLIDDYNEHINLWHEAGGKAFLIPQPWNTNHEYFGNHINVVERVDEWLVHVAHC